MTARGRRPDPRGEFSPPPRVGLDEQGELFPEVEEAEEHELGVRPFRKRVPADLRGRAETE